MKTIYLVIFILLSSCGTVVLPLAPSGATSELDCSHKCASLGMRGVFVGGSCGCEKRQ